MYGTLTSPDPTATLALEDLLPDYVHRDHDARRTARIAHAASLGDTLRRELLGRADAAGVPISAAERTELEASCLAGGHVRVWHCPVPLTLIDSLYYPVEHVMPPDDPGSLVIWLRPSQDPAYLRSVADLWAVMSPLGTPSREPELARAVTAALAWVRRGQREQRPLAAAHQAA
jgi:hypothetical protein